MPELLSICIPTYNRNAYLTELLESIAQQVTADALEGQDLGIYVSDNASTDGTRITVEKFRPNLPGLQYSCNESNIGGDNNILLCSRLGSGLYRWIVGDDELINPGALAYILMILRREKPVLFINNDGQYDSRLRLPSVFRNYRDLALASIEVHNPHLLIAHSLITANIFRSTAYDSNFAQTMINTNYGHMYGLVKGITINPGPIFLPDMATITVRQVRAGAENPNLLVDLPNQWSNYIRWLEEYLVLPGLESAYVKQMAPSSRKKVWRKFTSTTKKFVPRAIRTKLKGLVTKIDQEL